jgi:hypothetical protein
MKGKWTEIFTRCSIEDGDLNNMFGCVEMEQAATRILRRAISKDLTDIDVSYEDFTDDTDVLIGFIMLVGHGWLFPSYPNGMFTVDDEFFDRINELLPIDVTRRHLHEGKVD